MQFDKCMKVNGGESNIIIWVKASPCTDLSSIYLDFSWDSPDLKFDEHY